MEPLSIAAGVAAISNHCIRTARAIWLLKEKYQHAEQTISDICSESQVIIAGLGQIQAILSSNSEALRMQFKSQAALEATFDAALSGCTQVYSVLDIEILKLSSNEGSSVKAKVQCVWKKEIMDDLLQQIRGRQTALGLLVSALQLSLQMKSAYELQKYFEENTARLEQLAQSISELRLAHPTLKSPPSIFETSQDDVASLYSFNSGISATTFSIDRELVTTEAYRKALAHNKQKKSQHEAPNKEGNVAEGELKENDKTESKAEKNEPVAPENSKPVNEVNDQRGLARLLPENITLKKHVLELEQEAEYYKQHAERYRDERNKARVTAEEDGKLLDLLKKRLEKRSKDHEIQIATLEREKGEIEKTENLLRERTKKLEALDQDHRLYFEQITTEREWLRETQEKAMALKDEEFESKFREALNEEKRKFVEVVDDRNKFAQLLGAAEAACSNQQRMLSQLGQDNEELQRACQRLQEESNEKEAELVQWRPYAGLLTQLKSLPNPEISRPSTRLTTRDSGISISAQSSEGAMTPTASTVSASSSGSTRIANSHTPGSTRELELITSVQPAPSSKAVTTPTTKKSRPRPGSIEELRAREMKSRGMFSLRKS